MATNPEPGNRIAFEDTNGPVMTPNAGGVNRWVTFADLLELQARMVGIGLEEPVAFARLMLDVSGQPIKKSLEPLGSS